MSIIVSTSLPALQGWFGKNTGAARQVLEDLRMPGRLPAKPVGRAHGFHAVERLEHHRNVDREKLPPRKDPRLLSLTNMIEKQWRIRDRIDADGW